MISKKEKRDQRLNKRLNIPIIHKNRSIQTNNILINNQESQTEEEQKEGKIMINMSIQTEKIINYNHKSVQCNIINNENENKNKNKKKTSKINIDHYLISFFKKIERHNKDIKKVCYINSNNETEFKRFMLGVLDTNDDIYNIKFRGNFMGDINFKFYSHNKELFQINYDYKHPQSKDNLFSIYSKIDKNMLFKKRFKYNLKEQYEIKLEGCNHKYSIFFNNKKLKDIELQEDIMFFTSNSNFKIIFS
jgi:hypothetical protein